MVVFMKMVDFDYYSVLYDMDNNISEEISRLKYPQRYVKLLMNDELYDLEVVSVDDDSFILKIE